jgi:hypothetical protein
MTRNNNIKKPHRDSKKKPQEYILDDESSASKQSDTTNIRRNKKISNPLNQKESETTESLNYSSSDQTAQSIGMLRPSCTIKTNRQQSAEQKSSIKSWKQLFNKHKKTRLEPTQSDAKKFTQIKFKCNDSVNMHIGNIIPSDNDDETIIFHNVNGIKEEDNWHQILQTMKEMRAAIIGLVEINKSLRNQMRQQWKNTARKFFNHSRISHSESQVKFDNDYKPGGTMTITTGKWQARITEQGEDSHGLGRWSFQKISSTKSNLVIITAYRPCATNGPTTAWMQQWILLREKGVVNPDPVKIFYQDLLQLLNKWKDNGYEIILLIDANETLGENSGGLNHIVRQIELTDLILHKHPQLQETNTYARGSKQIDYILGTQRVREFCSAAGMLPFGTGYNSDHRQIFVQINIAKILNTNIKPLESVYNRKLQNATPRERKKFIEEVHSYFLQQNLFKRMNQLLTCDTWGHEQTKEYEACDAQHIEGMLYAESRTKKLQTTPWSPIFQQAVAEKSFWKIALSIKMNHMYPSESFLTWAESKGIEDFKGLDIGTVKQKLRQAQKMLREVNKQAVQLRETHLQELLTEAEIQDETQRKKRIKILLRAHQQQQAFKRLQNMLKPKSTGGLSYILVPEKFKAEDFPYDPNHIETWEQIHDPELIQDLVQKQNLAHFGQADGTPFTKLPLTSINWQADTIEAQEILRGSIPTSILTENQYVTKILQYIANRTDLPQIDTWISPEQVGQGFRKWRESTSTSPSGCHLGLRKIAAMPSADEETEKQRVDILQIQTNVINLPLQHGFSPRRWQTVVNAMLEKIPGRPMLHKL